jgi:hypothetical protein
MGLASKEDGGSGTVAGSGWALMEKGEGMVIKGGERGVALLSLRAGGVCDIV